MNNTTTQTAETTITINHRVAPAGAPVAVETAWYQYRGMAYVFACADGDGFMSYSASDGEFLVWSQRLEDARVDASLAEMDRMFPRDRIVCENPRLYAH